MSRFRSNNQLVPRNPLSLMSRVYRHVLPDVRSQLDHWRKQAERIPDPELRRQAIASMTSKQFHCEGGAVYAAANIPRKNVLIPLIVAFQTISDYLDNLCDRSTSLDPKDFRQLHESMLDAIDPSKSLQDYYAYRDEKEDGGYLSELVKTCQTCIYMLPTYDLVMEPVRELVSLYCDLQVYKHIRQDRRELELLNWWKKYEADYSGLKWNEFAAASGSTLGVFMLFLAATDLQLTEKRVHAIRDAYFPQICSLHILLDYLIDQEEDRIGKDLNFCSYYKDEDETVERILQMAERARYASRGLQDPPFHRMIIEGLLALYLSDPKVKGQKRVVRISKQIMKRSPMTRIFFWINSKWIRIRSS